MIVLTHKDEIVIGISDYRTNDVINMTETKPVKVLFQLAKQYPNRLIAWCHDDLKNHINHKGFQDVFHHKCIMASYEIRDTNYISDRIGYVESSPYININKNVIYPTWLMSSCIGAIHAKVLLKFNSDIFKNSDLAYALNSIAKKAMIKGLICYSAPELLLPNSVKLLSNKSTTKTLYKFIKQHYKSRWIFITFFNSFLYEKRLQFLPLFLSWFVKKRVVNIDFKNIKVDSSKATSQIKSIDVIIPTIGRKAFLLDVLNDLSKQTLRPKKVIIIEQNSELESKSELEYLKTEKWPFIIEHTFTHKLGACNARNIAINKVDSDMIFLADDDIRIESNILENAVNKMNVYGFSVATLSCLRQGERETTNQVIQWHTFGSGCSVMKLDVIKCLKFDTAFENGFGEDGDFGMQIRNLGQDVGYLPQCNLLHLKAPVGGFRTKFSHAWENEKILPKPSPTIMLFKLKHHTKFQILGYKTILFYKFYKLQSNKNVFSYITQMNKRWRKSIFLAKQLLSNNQ